MSIALLIAHLSARHQQTHKKMSLSEKFPQGFSMVEMMVALTILAIGLLGQMNLQMEGLSANKSAYLRSQAAILANDIMDRMRANEIGVTSGFYSAIDTSTGYKSSGCLNNAMGCTVTKLADEDKFEWSDSITTLLTNGSGTVVQNASGVFTITIKWGKTLKNLSASDSENYNQLVMSASL